MPVNVKRMLVFLLIILKETGPTTACGDTCTSSTCSCTRLDLRSVPQFLPTTITSLNLNGNAITTFSQSDLSRYSSLIYLNLQTNQISVISSGAFYNLTRLITLYLHYNRLTSLRADMFVGLDNLQDLWLDYNNIHSIEAGTFSNNPHLRRLRLSNNRINTFPSAFLSNLDLSEVSDLRLENNQMETLPPAAYDILAAVSPVYLSNNPWQCDCRMLPFKLNMTGFYTFEYTIICAEPAQLQGKSLLHDVDPDDLICEETTTEISSIPSTSSPALRSTQHVHVPSSPITPPSTTNFDSESSSSTTPRTTHFHLTSSQADTPSTTNFHSGASPTAAPSTTNFHSEASQTTAPSTINFHSEASATETPSSTNFHPDASPKATPSTTQPRVTEIGTASSPGSFSLSAFLSGLPGGIIGSLLILNILLAIRCIRRRGKSSSASAPMSDPSVIYSNIDEATASVSINVNSAEAAAAAPIKGRDRTGHVASASRAAESTPGRSVLRSPLPPINGAGPHGDYQNAPAATDASNHYEPLRNHLIHQ